MKIPFEKKRGTKSSQKKKKKKKFIKHFFAIFKKAVFTHYRAFLCYIFSTLDF